MWDQFLSNPLNKNINGYKIYEICSGQNFKECLIMVCRGTIVKIELFCIVIIVLLTFTNNFEISFDFCGTNLK